MKGLLLALLCAVAPLSAAVRPNLDQGLALQGYDAVSYFDAHKAQRGSGDFEVRLPEGTYRFSSAAHREAFRKTPQRYEPAYGGWCAYAMSRGELVEVDPENFKIVHGELLLFYRSLFIDTLKRWNDKEADLWPLAEASWKHLNEDARNKDAK